MNSPDESDAQIDERAEQISYHYSKNKQRMWFHFVVVLVDGVSHGNRITALQELAVAKWKLSKETRGKELVANKRYWQQSRQLQSRR